MTSSFTTTLPQSLVQSYLHTEYRVLGDTPMTLRASVANPSIGDLLKRFKVHGCAFITACNPNSQQISAAENEERMGALEAELKSRGLHFLPSVAVDPFGEWPDEPSFLVMGLSLESAKALAARHGQNAILWCGATLIPELILLR